MVLSHPIVRLAAVIAIVVAPLLALPTAVRAQDPDYVLRGVGTAGTVGGTVELSIELDNAEGVNGYSFGIAHPPTLEPVELILGSVLVDIPPDFEQIVIVPGGITVGIVYFGAGIVWIPPAAGQEIHRFRYDVLPGAVDTIDLPFTDTLGNPPVDVDVSNVVTGGEDPTLEHGSVFIGPPLLRGDANGDGAIDIGDGTRLLWWVIAGQGDPLLCSDQGDANDDGVVDIADGVTVLSYLFLGGQSALTGTCTTDTTPDALDCTTPSCP